MRSWRYARPGTCLTTGAGLSGVALFGPSDGEVSPSLHRVPDDECEALVRTVPVGHRGLGFGYPDDDVIVFSCGPTSTRARSRTSQPVAYLSRPAAASSSGAMAMR